MRQARSFVGNQFNPTSADDFIDSIRRGDQHTAYILQVFGYWDMVCAFVVHGTLPEPLVYDTCQEMYFQYSKIQPYLDSFREKMNLPEWMRSLQAVAECSEQSRAGMKVMRENVARMAAIRKEKSNE